MSIKSQYALSEREYLMNQLHMLAPGTKKIEDIKQIPSLT